MVENPALLNFIKQQIENGQEDSFVVIDLKDIHTKLVTWRKSLPRVEPFYAVKCNDNIDILNEMANLGINFDCASMGEISKVLSLGVSPERIIYANPCKQITHLQGAHQAGVRLMTFDNQDELKKIKTHCPNAIVVLRLATDDSKAICRLSQKFGAPLDKVKSLLQKVKQHELEFGGFSYHVGSGCEDEDSFVQAVKNARTAFDVAESLGLEGNILDIGGGFSGDLNRKNRVKNHFEDVAKLIEKALDMYFPAGSKYRLIAEPGRYFVHSCGTVAASIIARRVPTKVEPLEELNLNQQGGSDNEAGSEQKHGETDEALNEVNEVMYYINEGVYGAFNNTIYDHQSVQPKILPQTKSASAKPAKQTGKNKDPAAVVELKSSIWGPTCDGLDCVARNIYLPKMKIGDWFYFENMGAYTIAAGSNFNGFNRPKVYCINGDANLNEPQDF